MDHVTSLSHILVRDARVLALTNDPARCTKPTLTGLRERFKESTWEKLETITLKLKAIVSRRGVLKMMCGTATLVSSIPGPLASQPYH